AADLLSPCAPSTSGKLLPLQRLRGTAALLSGALAGRKGRPAPRNGRRLTCVCSLGEEGPKRVRVPARYSRAEQPPRLGGPRDLIFQADYNTSEWRRQASPSRRTRRRPGRIGPAGRLPGAEAAELAGGRGALDVQRLDLGPAGALAQIGLDLVEPVRIALGLDPDRAVGEVLGVAGEAQLAGLALHRPAEPDPLDLALDHGPQPLRAHARMITGVPRGRVSASRVMVSLSMRTQPLDTGPAS